MIYRCIFRLKIIVYFLTVIVPVYGIPTVNDFYLVHYTVENGLPQNSARAISVDNQGFIWLATEMGIARFDGRNFKLFNRSNTSVSSNRFFDIIKDPGSSDQLMGMNIKGESLRLQAGKVTTPGRWYDIPFTPFDITGQFGGERYTHPILTFNYIGNNYWNQSEHILMADDRHAIRLSRNRVEWFSSGGRYAAFSASKDLDLSMVFNRGEHVYIISPEVNGNTAQVLLPGGLSNTPLYGDILLHNRPVRRVAVNRISGQVFFICDDQLYLAEPDIFDGIRTTLLLSGFDFSNEYICDQFYDQERDMLFLGSLVNGLFVFKKKYFTSKLKPDARAIENVVAGQVMYNDSSVLTDKGLVFSSGRQEPFSLSLPIANGYTFLLRAGESAVWIAQRDVLYLYDQQTGAARVIAKLDHYISAMAMINGQLWCGLSSGDIFTIDYSDKEALPIYRCTLKGYVYVLAEYNGFVWGGTEVGLYRVNKDDYQTTAVKELDGEVVRGLYPLEEEEGLWICTYSAGLWLHRKGILTRFPPDKGGYLNTVHAILQDRRGYLWISTNNGIFQTSKKDLIAYADDPSAIPFFLHYGKEAGFKTSEFNGGNGEAGVKLSNGFFSFASMKGSVFFHPDSVIVPLPWEAIIIDKIEIDNKETNIGNRVELPADFQSLSITLATPYFGNPRNLILEYSLDHHTWTPLVASRLSFNNFPVGDHNLLIRKRAGFGSAYVYREIRVMVFPAWWETKFFRAVVILFILALAWLVFRIRFYWLRQQNKYLEKKVALQTEKLRDNIAALEHSEELLKKENRFQERLSRQIVHDIRTPLKYLVYASKKLYEKVSASEQPTLKESNGIYTSSEQVYQFVDRLMSFLAARNIKGEQEEEVNIYELIEQKFKIFELAARTQHNRLINLVPGLFTASTSPTYIDIVLHNLLDNAVKQTTNGSITVHAKHRSDYLEIRISDTGHGIPAPVLNEYNEYFNNESKNDTDSFIGFGFIAIKHILPLINASLRIYPNNGPGCSIYFNIKIY